LRRPFPSFVGKVEAEPPNTLRLTADQRLCDRRFPKVIDRLFGHGSRISVVGGGGSPTAKRQKIAS
jgi:hypothetical protein